MNQLLAASLRVYRHAGALTCAFALLALGGSLALRSDRAEAIVAACPCTILIQVDGLEPQDVSQAGTPFMWGLAHPNETSPAPGQAGRHGFIWGSARTGMGATTAASTASLLTGSYAELHDVPTDDFIDPTQASARFRLGGGAEGFEMTSADNIRRETLPQAITGAGGNVGEYSGDPALANYTNADAIGDNASWVPDSSTGNPAYCAPPDPLGTPVPPPPPAACPANDAVTLQNALSGLQNQTSSGIGFAFIHLAEVGAVKRKGSDAEVGQALTSTDAAIQQFVTSYSDATGSPSTAAKWPDTILFVVGDHGYESTPVAQRVPDPTAASDPTRDLTDYVEGLSPGHLSLIQQGTLATVYYRGDEPARRATIADAKAKIEAVNQASACAPNGCIEEVLYTQPDPVSGATTDTVAAQHPSWHIDGLSTTGAHTGVSGDLVVVMKPGWAAGRQASPLNPSAHQIDDVNGYNASSGGPRNRPIAAFVNGSADNIKAGTATSSDNSDPGDDANAAGHEGQAETVDFAPTIGAFMKIPIDSIQLQGRLLQEAFRNPLALFNPDEEPLPEPAPEPEPPPLPPPLPPPAVVVEPPKDPFTFTGLVQHVKAQVVDDSKAALAFAKAPRGATFSTIQISGDFGRPKSQVVLTFYQSAKPKKKKKGKKKAPGKGKAAARSLKAIVRFDPFVVTRGKVTIKLKVPAQYAPTHIGVSVQEVRDRAPGSAPPAGSTRKRPLSSFEPFGPISGALVQIRDSLRLHTRKGAAKSKPKTKKKSKKKSKSKAKPKKR
jgi:hypothetical protein